jgi:hypothetical protein
MAGTLELQFADDNGSFDNRLRHYEGTYISILLRNARKWAETKNGMEVWRIIRRDDNMVIAQSKAAPQAASVEAPVADASLPFAEGIDDYEDTSVLYADFVREQYARADAEDLAEMNSETLEDYDSYIARKERDSLSNPDYGHIGTWDADTDDELWAAGGSPFIPAIDDDSEPVIPTTDGYEDVVIVDTPAVKVTTWRKLPAAEQPRFPSAARNRRNQPKTAKFSDLRHRKTSGINMELKAPKNANKAMMALKRKQEAEKQTAVDFTAFKKALGFAA